MTRMTMQIYCLDTNIFQGLKDTEADNLLAFAQRNAMHFRCTPIVIIEILSHMKDEYPQTKASLRRVVTLCCPQDYLLPVPDHQIAIALGLEEHIRPGLKESRRALLQGVDVVLKSSSPDDVAINDVCSPDLIGQKLLDNDAYKQIRMEYEPEFINGVNAIAERSKSDYKGRSLALAKAMTSTEALVKLIVGLVTRCSDLEESEIYDQIPKLAPRLVELEAYCGYYWYIMNHWIDQGRLRDNPYNDLHQLIYLSIENSYLITGDKRFVEHVPPSPQRDRILIWQEVRQRLLSR